MNHLLFTYGGITITSWKLVGYAGTICFTLRWLVQAYASRAAKKPVIPLGFWLLSLFGSLLLLLYFSFGKNDGPGIISNLFPLLMATYNLYLELRSRARLPNSFDCEETESSKHASKKSLLEQK